MLSHDDPLPLRPQRILVAGASGSGKTTLARRIATRLALPYTEIDALFHGPGWTPRPEFLDDVRRLAAGPAWVTEWLYGPARPLLAAAADLMVWVDQPVPVTMTRVVRRTVRRSWQREELWNGNVEPGVWRALTEPEGIIRWSWVTRHKYRRQVPEVEAELPGLTVVRLRRQRDIDRWTARLGRG